MIRINNIKLKLDENETVLTKCVCHILRIEKINAIHIVKKAIDARNKKDIFYVYSVDVEVENEEKYLKLTKNNLNVSLSTKCTYVFPVGKPLSKRPIVVGSGPAGLFCSLFLARNGYNPIVLERGKSVDERQKDISSFWSTGALNNNSNVQFGEGGAGTFSDGKLTTGVKDIRIHTILEEFVKHGAPAEILYLAKPHIGTDNLRKIVKNIREEIVSLGGTFKFQNTLIDLNIENSKITGAKIQNADGSVYMLDTDIIILATGHSARDTYQMLYKNNIMMEPKPFSIGARIEHSQEMVNKSQFGDFYKKLPAADYKLAIHLPNGRSAYTFCMCPGGQVVNSSSEYNGVVTNGMSNFSREGENANSALLVNVNPSDFKTSHPLAGIELQREIEKACFIYAGSNYNAPAQLVGDFLNNKDSSSIGKIIPTFLPNVKLGNLNNVLPNFITETMKEAILLMNKHLNGFAEYDAVLTAPETRSSSPVRIIRNLETLETNIKGLYTAGEGGGHAGGITTSAADGIKAAESIAKHL